MKLEEIIETVKHDAEYFADPQTAVQAGRAFEATKILNMLYKLQTAQLQQHSVVQAEGSDGVKVATVGKEREEKGVSVEKNCPKCGSNMIVTNDRLIYCDFIGCDYSRAI
jgi:hypothetical protein